MTSIARFACLFSLSLLACSADKGQSPVSDEEPTADVIEHDVEGSPPDTGSASTLQDTAEQPPPPPPGPAVPEPCITFTPDAADPSDAVFDPTCVLDVHVDIDYGDWDELRKQTRAFVDIVKGDCLAEPPSDIFTWFHADVTIAGETLTDVGIRKKGFLGSLSTEKPSLKIRFDKYTDDQNLATLTRLTLNNMNQDPGLINTCLAYQVMAEAGLPAPRCGFARVFVNNQDLGVYAHVDSIKKPFLSRHFTSDDGNLYEATVSDFRPEFLGTWEKKTNNTENDWSDMEAAIAALEASDDELIAALEGVFDLDAFYTFWATEVLIGHWDGYAGNRNNTYLYADPLDGLFRFIPWGADSVFLDPQYALEPGLEVPDSVYAFGHLAYRLYMHPIGRVAYRERLQSLLETAWDGPGLVDEIDRLETLLQPHLPVDQRETMAVHLEGRRAWVDNRETQLHQELLGDAPEWEVPPQDTFCWPHVGTVSGTFDTEWGTAGWNYLQQIGTVDHDVDGLDPLGNIAANARHGNGFTEGLGVIELVGNDLQGHYILLILTGPPELVAPNTTYPIDWKSFNGYLGGVEFLDMDFELLGVLLDGVISFEKGSTYPGERVTGSFSADVIRPP
ncbi:MAG: CotH kinase family protein [Myxococcota bacterium]|nr:CotH kinase family protein [Myxococcota bacterium]